MRSLPLVPVCLLLAFLEISLAVEEDAVCPNGLAFSKIAGFEKWTLVAAHLRTDKRELRYVLGNETALRSYLAGAGIGGKKFEEGSILVKVKYDLLRSPDFPDSLEPGRLKAIEYMVKDGAAFPETDGWGYAPFTYDASAGSVSAGGEGPKFHQACHKCHAERVARKDFVFTDLRNPSFRRNDAALYPVGAPGGIEVRVGPQEAPERSGGDRPVVGPASTAALKPVKVDGLLEDGEYASRASLGGGVLEVFWRLEGREAFFGVKAKTAGWVSIGFDPSEKMKDADMVVAWVENGVGRVEDQFCTGRFGPHQADEKLGGTSDLIEAAASESGDITTFEFRRLLDTGDRCDKPLSPAAEVKVIWAIGPGDDPGRKHATDGEAFFRLSDERPRETPPAPRGTPLWPVHAGFMDLVAGLGLAAFVLARRKRLDREWLPKHKAVGLVLPFVLLGALATAIYMVQGKGGEHFDGPHAFVGAAAALALLVMPVLGYAMLLIPAKRAALRLAHVWVGRAALLAALAGALSGLFAAGLL